MELAISAWPGLARRADPAPSQDALSSIAREKVIADLDTFSDVIAAGCFQRTDVDSDWHTRIPGRLAQADTAELLHAALVAADREDADTCLEAVRLLLQRHLQRSARRIDHLAAELAEG